MNDAAPEHLPASSGTPSAWRALALLAAVAACMIFFDALVSGALRVSLSLLAWSRHATLKLDHLALRGNGIIQAKGVTVVFGDPAHPSLWKCDLMEVRLAPVTSWIGLSKGGQNHWIREVNLGKGNLLLDFRGDASARNRTESTPFGGSAIPWFKLLPDAVSAGPLDLVINGKESRISITGLYGSLPDRWMGRLVYSEASVDLGAVHRTYAGTSAPASWDGSTLRLGKIMLAKELNIEELTLTPQQDRLDFGFRGGIGKGLLRSDGSVALGAPRNLLAVTLVGENLQVDALAQLVKAEKQHATGTIGQGRFTFRGDPDRPLEADSSLRLVADNFRWEGRGWDTLRLAATLTGRVCTLSELVLFQNDNEVVAQGESHLPEDWHQALKAPFTASFHALFDDVGALASLAGPSFGELSGGLEFEGAIKGAENKAEGYCNLESSGMKIRDLPVDWLKGCLLFEGAKTRLSNLEAWSGKDRVVLEGSVGNNAPHDYSASAEFGVENLTKRLVQLGIATAARIGGGAVQGTWKGDGSMLGHSGIFQAKAHDWVSPWTRAGMSGDFEGSYSPGHLYFSKADFLSDDLQLALALSASPTLLEAKSIKATRRGKPEPLVQGELSLPVNAPALWASGDLVPNLGMKEPLSIQLKLHGIKAEELADLLGQKVKVKGTMEGMLSAAGTPEMPEIHSTLKIANLSLPDQESPAGLTWGFDSVAGRATCKLIQEPTKTPPLSLEAEIPFSLTRDKRTLRLSDPKGALHAAATFHQVPMAGWLSLAKGSAWLPHGGIADGSLVMSGTVEQPLLGGSLLVTAPQVSIPALPLLSNVRLPINCSSSKVTVTEGSALYGTNGIGLAAMYDWSNTPTIARLDLSGKNLPFPKVVGLESLGDAELSLHKNGSEEPPTLSGNLMIKQIRGTPGVKLVPGFVPPGLIPEQPLTLPSREGEPPRVRLDLHATTDGFLPLNGSDGKKIQADLHFQGGDNNPTWSGVIMAENATMELPAGSFMIPHARIESVNGSRQQCFYTAYGMTSRGMSFFQHDDSGDAVWCASLAGDKAATLADLRLSLASSGRSGSVPLSQATAWIRQNILFPTPPATWIMHREGDPELGAQGFYGGSWSMALWQAPAFAPLLPETGGSSKP